MSDKTKLALKVFGIVGPLAVVVTGMLYKDPVPVIYDICQTLLPNGSINRIGQTVVTPKMEPDAGAVRQ